MEDHIDKSGTTYTDIVLQVLSAYLSSEDMDSYDLANEVIETYHNDPKVSGPGMLPGLFFSSIIHMSLMLKILSGVNNISIQEALKKYALSYEGMRDMVCLMPQVHPSIVNEIIEKFQNDL